MTQNQFITCLILLLSLTIVSSCGDLIGSSDSAEAMNWNEGGGIAPADDQHLSEEQRERYRQDAEKLAVRYINDRDSTQTAIPENLVALLYNGLVHVVNSDHPKADEATEEYEVHARAPASPREILVFADTTAPWVDAWRAGETETGNRQIDKLVNEFNLDLVDYSELSNVLSTSMATLRSNRAINVFAVGRLFEELNDVESAGPDHYTDGSDISVLFFDDHLRYSFEFGFGDCPSGCINRHIWHFNVHEDGTVEFDGEKGDPLPGD